jgi:class 3 adenylate cyclase
LSIDLAEFTALAEGIDPEDAGEMMSDLWRCLQGVMETHGGRLDKHSDETATFLFGIPEAREAGGPGRTNGISDAGQPDGVSRFGAG